MKGKNEQKLKNFPNPDIIQVTQNCNSIIQEHHGGKYEQKLIAHVNHHQKTQMKKRNNR